MTKRTSSLKACFPLFALAAGLLLGHSMSAAVTFSVTPAAVSNSYREAITLQVAGLATGDDVVVQKFLDINTNGVIDGGDLLAQQFRLTDGQAGMVIGGVTNWNVPGDTDTAAGQITAKMNFYNGDFMQTIVGNFLFKLSSPAGRFAPVTNTFTVTSFPYGQKFTGNVVNNGTNVPNAVVLVFDPRRKGGPSAGAVANETGSYTISAPAGTYSLVSFKSNFVVSFAEAPSLTLASGTIVATNLMLANATATISGKVVDAADSSIGLPGILLPVEAESGLIAITFTDPNGNFSVRVSAGQWGVQPDNQGLILHGYAGTQDRIPVDAGAAGVSVGVAKGTALVYGRVRDGQGNPLPGIDLYAQDSRNYQYETDGFTDGNGKYWTAVPAGDWWMEITTDNAPDNYVFPDGQSLTLAAGQAVRKDWTCQLATNRVTGTLRDNYGNPISGVGIWANATIGGTAYRSDTETDADGRFSVSVANNNTWTIGIENCSDCSHGLPGNYLSPGSQTISIRNDNPVVDFTVLANDQNITGQVQDSAGNPIGGVRVNAWATIDDTFYQNQADTDSSGNFVLNVVAADWSVNLECVGDNHSLDALLGSGTYQCPEVQNVSTAAGNATANFIVERCNGVQIVTTSLPDGQVNMTYDTWLQAATCNGFATWSLGLGGSFPPGLNLGGEGRIYGTPEAGGTFTFSVRVDDGHGQWAEQDLSLYIEPSSSPLQVITTFLPTATNGVFYSQRLEAVGGSAPYRWSIPNYAADPPPSLTLSADGVLSGTLAVSGGPFYFDVEVADAAAGTASQTLSVYVFNPPTPPLGITNTALPAGNAGVEYRAQLGATGGLPPYNWTLALGSAPLPAGLSLSSDGLISGVPATNKVSTFKVRVSDMNSGTDAKVITLTINARPVLGVPVWQANHAQMWLTGAANQNYTVQTSTNLNPASWRTLWVTNCPTTNSFLVNDPGATNQQRYYRVLIGP